MRKPVILRIYVISLVAPTKYTTRPSVRHVKATEHENVWRKWTHKSKTAGFTNRQLYTPVLPATRLDELQGRYGRCGGTRVCRQSSPDCVAVGIFALLRCYAPYVGSLLPTFWKNYQSHPQRSSSSVDGADRLYRTTGRLLT
jgi:hypothetical protein